MTVKIINKSNHPLPSYQTIASAGMDIRAYIAQPVVLKPMQRAIIKTGLYLELPIGTEAQVRPRSGLAAKKGITVLNSPGTIDSDYRGELGIILMNLSDDKVVIESGDRIAQLVFAKVEKVLLEKVEVVNKTDRGEGGFGSTGIK